MQASVAAYTHVSSLVSDKDAAVAFALIHSCVGACLECCMPLVLLFVHCKLPMLYVRQQCWHGCHNDNMQWAVTASTCNDCAGAPAEFLVFATALHHHSLP
jgi:hypothetical protein